MSHVSGIFFYPLKSMAGISLESGRLDDLGLRGDRRWMLIDGNCRHVSQREVHRLCMVQPEFTPDGLKVTAPGMEPLVIERGADGPRIEVSIWRDQCLAADTGAATSEWFSEYTGVPVRLVYLPSDSTRRIDPTYDALGRRTSFTDGFPLLFTTESSLADLNGRMEFPVPMNRFRPSVVIGGTGAWTEDGWERLRINGVGYDVSKPCARCVITTVDQLTGEGGKEPLATLATFRQVGGKTLFGRNVIHRDAGIIRVGDKVEVFQADSRAARRIPA